MSSNDINLHNSEVKSQSSFLFLFVLTILAVFMSFLRKYKPFNSWVLQQVNKAISSSSAQMSSRYYINNRDFKIIDSERNTLNESKEQHLSLGGLFETLLDLNEYKLRAKRNNMILSHRAYSLRSDFKAQLEDINYFQKLDDVDAGINSNYNIIKSVIENTLQRIVKNNQKKLIEEGTESNVFKDMTKMVEKLGFKLKIDNTASEKVLLIANNGSIINQITNRSSNQSRVIESLQHLVRDYSNDYDVEILPLITYINEQINQIETSTDFGKTLVVIPGPGVGRLPYEISKKYPKYQVESIEWSNLMYLFNEFAMNSQSDLKIIPFLQYYSSQLNKSNQLRQFEVQLKNFTKPTNLSIKYGDFRKYKINTTKNQVYQDIIVVTAYFIDTAENIIDYIETIEKLSLTNKNTNIHWINIGPLKYGTKPTVQLSFGEIEDLLKLRQWNFKNIQIHNNQNNLNGYLTDYNSLYQGYYGTVGFHCEYNHKLNKPC